MGLHDRRVGLFGAYHATNFGDDLMAVIFARTLEGLGVPFTVFGLGKEYEARYGFPVCSSAAELVDASDLIVVGGGGLLQPHKTMNPGFVGRELGDLLEACRKRSVPILCFSLGGAGLPLDQITPDARRQLVERAEYCTLRLRAELPLLEQAKTPGAHHDDVVFTTPSFFPPLSQQRSESGRLRIGICLHRFSRGDWRLFKVFFHVLAWVRRDCDFVFFESRFAETGRTAKRALNPTRTLRLPNCSYYKFDSLEDGTEFLQGLDLVITNRLHLGVTAMSYGKAYIGLLPKPKTRIQLRELGLDQVCWVQRWKLFTLLVPALLRRVIRGFESFDLERVREDAALHLGDLEEKLRELLGPDDAAPQPPPPVASNSDPSRRSA
jgi:polysaccharide pyruvyl transferase WcaK-like protein